MAYFREHLEKAVDECKNENWQVCTIVNVDDVLINDEFFDEEWNKLAYKTVLSARVKGFNL